MKKIDIIITFLFAACIAAISSTLIDLAWSAREDSQKDTIPSEVHYCGNTQSNRFVCDNVPVRVSEYTIIASVAVDLVTCNEYLMVSDKSFTSLNSQNIKCLNNIPPYDNLKIAISQTDSVGVK